MLLQGIGGFIFGAVAGSFLATVLLRWPQGRSALQGRSTCDHCDARLASADLIPLVSFLALRGSCRRCGGAIDSRHFQIELAAAFIGALALAAHPWPAGPATALFGWWLLLLAALDLEHHWLPDRLTLPLIPVGLAVAALDIGPSLDVRIIGCAAGFLGLAGIGFAYRKWRGRVGLGGGDPKLLAAIGAWLGWQQLPLVLVAAGLLGLTSLLLARFAGREIEATDRLPLGTLMALAAWPIWLLTAG